jgi:glycine oxidase
MDVTVIGAGVAGLSCAVELAQRGLAVEVIDRAEHLGCGCCSWFAGGMLAPWCEREHASPLVSDLGTESLSWWRKQVADTVVSGTLVVAHGRDAAELTRFSRLTEHHQWLDGQAISQLEPDLAGRFSRALFFREEGHLDPRKALAVLVRRLAQLKVDVQYGIDGSTSVRRKGSPWSIDCTGLRARETLTDLRGVKGEMLILRTAEISLSRPVRVLHPRVPVYVVPRGNGLFMVGATTIENDQPTRISVHSMLELLTSAYALHPAFGEAEIVEIGSGVRPAFPDNLPRIRRIGNVLYVNGLYRHGFLVAPALARRVAEVVQHGRHFPEVMDEDLRERCLA